MRDLFDGVKNIPNQETMAQTALVFLDDPLARRLAVAWPACQGDEEFWPEAAGVSRNQMPDAQRLMRALRLNGVCRDGGVTDPLALQYITAIVAEPLKKVSNPRGKGRR